MGVTTIKNVRLVSFSCGHSIRLSFDVSFHGRVGMGSGVGWYGERKETRTQMDGQQSEVGKIGEEEESTRSQRTRSILVLLLNVVLSTCRDYTELILCFLKSTDLRLSSVRLLALSTI